MEEQEILCGYHTPITSNVKACVSNQILKSYNRYILNKEDPEIEIMYNIHALEVDEEDIEFSLIVKLVEDLDNYEESNHMVKYNTVQNNDIGPTIIFSLYNWTDNYIPTQSAEVATSKTNILSLSNGVSLYIQLYINSSIISNSIVIDSYIWSGISSEDENEMT